MLIVIIYASNNPLRLQIKCVVEVRDYEHSLQLKEALINHYGNVIWGTEAVHS